ncbi:sphingosine-1-phosphate lyase 1 [Stylonychia lemnae]|uniref:sphinganine-1-phosphate aldolase n=1 Tax=Stylonychia lemnae TaxID=5949 RepID=A0A078A2K1_STYLE|nr:sphingosine-1-phosphate lyase 1 [Stylonychia lemnae]|eukprot:CDW75009.1 sphingosine-1-phosphate lyase 1 [Stylonychia lemnae]
MIGIEKSADLFEMMNKMCDKSTWMIQQANEYLRGYEPVTLIVLAILTQKYLKKKEDEVRDGFRKEIKGWRKNLVYKLPQTPWREDTIITRMQQGSEQARAHYTEGAKISGAVYTSNMEHWDFITDVMRLHIESNPLHMSEFAFVGQLEAEIIRMGLELYHGPQGSCGLLTSGGSESIFISCLAYRQQGRRKGITKPNIVCSNTAHAGFDKAAFYLAMEIRKVPLTHDMQCDIKALTSKIDSNTVMLVASSPDYSFGKYDPVPVIAKMAQDRGIGCHSDCCLGSFVGVFAEEAGFKQPYLFDFRVEGVTSISSDPQKFGYGPKGASLLMFRDKKLREGTFIGVTEWNGGMYVTPTAAGSRSGAVIAGTWAALMKQGRDGFLEKAKNILTAARKMRDEIMEIPDIELCSNDDTCVVSFTSKKYSCIAVADLMQNKFKWTLSKLQMPASAHLIVTEANYVHANDFALNLKACVEELIEHPELNNKGDAAKYRQAAEIPDNSVLNRALYMTLDEVLEINN